MSIARLVFDLPIDREFDYSIPQGLEGRVVVGVRVQVTLGVKPMVGLVVAVMVETECVNPKSVKALIDASPVFDSRDVEFARKFCAYYGCVFGQALILLVRHRKGPLVTSSQNTKPPVWKLFHCPDGRFAEGIESLTRNRDDYHILVPDAYALKSLSAENSRRIGLRSSMFQAFGHIGLLIMVAEENPSYKQEQSPRYESRQVVLAASGVYHFDVVFMSASPSVELMYAARQGVLEFQTLASRSLPKFSVVDLANYKFLEKRILSAAVYGALQANVRNQLASLVLLNRRGSFSATRCADCGHILKCAHCDSPVVYSRSRKGFGCRYCAAVLEAVWDCPQCGKNHWKSLGMGIEQVRKEIADLFPGAAVAYMDKSCKILPEGFDILIATQAVLRFQHHTRFATVALVDFDAELNRMDMRASFKAWSLAAHVRLLGRQIFIQTRQIDHHVLRAIVRDDPDFFYSEEFRLRRDLGFSPFKHWMTLTVRSKKEDLAKKYAGDMYNTLNTAEREGIIVTAAEPDTPAKVRDQHRFRLMLQGDDVAQMTSFIKIALEKVKRNSRVIVTMDVDP